MSKNQKAAVLMVAALAGQVYLGKVAKQQGAALGLSVTAVSLIGYAIGAEGDTRLPSRKAKRHRLRISTCPMTSGGGSTPSPSPQSHGLLAVAMLAMTARYRRL
ncbi:hypothetical protein AAW14_12420 [Streptomyces hygroscopicus]|uniref:hypothetical protein n=1 Tax=Streptomyces hygroscopicus TaxID=1912 RepID=UPI00223F4514|nr:hypothetical protein [Streptomyces hygroscopicus]MCW7942826.1 hypothetical protein [Streptomyces hygroscopicus]